jgi:hypothetical protein
MGALYVIRSGSGTWKKLGLVRDTLTSERQSVKGAGGEFGTPNLKAVDPFGASA